MTKMIIFIIYLFIYFFISLLLIFAQMCCLVIFLFFCLRSSPEYNFNHHLFFVQFTITSATLHFIMP